MNVFSIGLIHLVLSAVVGDMGIPLGIPPQPESPALARVAPEECLFYTSWSGAASPDAKSRSQTEQLLAEPEMQHLFREIERGITTVFMSEADWTDNKAHEGMSKMIDGVRLTLYHPAAFFVSKYKFKERTKENPALNWDCDPAGIEIGFIISLGKETAQFRSDWDGFLALLRDIPEHNAALQKMFDSQNTSDQKAETKKIEVGEADYARILDTVEIKGEKWHRIRFSKDSPTFTCGFDGDYFIFACGEKAVDGILERMNKETPPRWWSAIGEETPIERRSTVTYVNLRAIRELVLSHIEPEQRVDAQAVVEMLGLANASALTEVSGLEGEDFFFKTRLALDGDPQGLLKAISANPLSASDLAPIPIDSTLALAARIDLKRVVDEVSASVEKLNPGTRRMTNAAIEYFETELMLDIPRSMLDLLGDTWCVYNSPGEGGLVATGLTAVVPLRSKPGFSKALELAYEVAKKKLEPQKEPDFFSLFSPKINKFRFANYDIYCLNLMMVSPALCMTEKDAILSLTPQNIKAYLGRGEDYQPLSRLPRIAEIFSGEKTPIIFVHIDSPKLFEIFYPIIMCYAPGPFSMLGGDESKGIGLDCIPSAASIGRHLRPTEFTFCQTKGGFELDTRGTFPTPGPMLTATVMALGFFENCPVLSGKDSVLPSATTNGTAESNGIILQSSGEQKEDGASEKESSQ